MDDPRTTQATVPGPRAGRLRVGCAGWSLPSVLARSFPEQGTHLRRYASVFDAVEINSSFYRPHRRETYVRWAESVPPEFRYSVKLPRAITHERRLRDVEDLLDGFLSQVAGLGPRLGCLLVQLPPSLEYRRDGLEAFLDQLQARYRGPVVLEPRHASWFEGAACVQLTARRVARVAADPPPALGADRPAGDRGTSYFRLHGTPRMYYSDYDAPCLATIATQLEAARAVSAEVWCIFDNTALGAAPRNALDLQSAWAAMPLSAGRPAAPEAGKRA